MFQVNREENRLRKLQERKFSELNIRERQHLQEWFANQPDALGEELLVIQKEFSGFAETRERLDLLALDALGQLVVIENKLDDSGRDVAWQAIKYAAYVSSLTKSQVIDIFQQYLDRHEGGGNAVQRICDFLGEEELEEVTLNPGNNQRIIFIAANFRKEVTSTVLWLREQGIDARCIKVVPYLFGEEVFVDVKPVIPTPESADFMISMAEKEAEAKTAQGRKRRSHEIRMAYWSQLLDAFKESGLTRYENVSPSKDNWLPCATGRRGVIFSAVMTQREARVEVVMQSSDKARNKDVFDKLLEKRSELDAKFGQPLDWVRMDAAKMSKIMLVSEFDSFNQELWPEMTAWFVENMTLIQKAFEGPIASLE